MADTKISGLSAATAAAAANEFAINEAGTSKKLTGTQLESLLGIKKARLTGDHAISSTTGTEVMAINLDRTGIWTFTMNVIVQSATATVAPQLGINFDGTAAASPKNWHWRFADATTVITAAVHSMDNVGITAAGFIDGMAHNAFSTTAPNMWTSVANSVAATAADILCFIEGTIKVDVAGNLELWHASETATSTTVKAGTVIQATHFP